MDNLSDFVNLDDDQFSIGLKKQIMQNKVDFSNFYIEKMTEDTVNAVFEIENKLLGTSSFNTIQMALSSNTLEYYTLIKKENKEVIGFLEISMIVPDCELYDIAIKKEYQGKHLSNILMEFLINLCKDKKCETIFLEVNSINNKALRLYKKFGFNRYSTRKNYYGKFDAILMKKDL